MDLEIGSNKKISRQHAAILYNFEQERFEIKCLSKKYFIKVNGRILTHRSIPAHLYNKSLITVGSENFLFFLPKLQSFESNSLINQDNKEENKEELEKSE